MNNEDPKDKKMQVTGPFLYSKTNLKKNDQCTLQFYNERHTPEDKKYPEQTLKLFSQGNKIDSESKKQFPNHIEIKHRANLKAFENTMKIIDKAYDDNRALLQSCFIDKQHNVVVRVDILVPDQKRSWKMVEVKSSTKVKEDYYDDVLIQYYAALSCGVKISNVEVWVIDKKNKLEFKKRDLTEHVITNKQRYYDLLNKAINTNRLTKPPAPTYGNYCEGCPFRWKCFQTIDGNPQHVVNLPSFGEKWKAVNSGITSVKSFEFKEQYSQYISEHPLIYQALISNKPLINFPEVQKKLNSLKYPLFFLDMEAVSYAIPLIENSFPYENILSQYSLHKLDESNKTVTWILEQIENINWDEIATDLLTHLESTGTIVVWGEYLELTLLRGLQKKVKDSTLKKRLQALEVRFFDLQSFFEKNVYSPQFLGKINLKNVSKILTNISYDDLRIQNGISISHEFKNFIETKSKFIKKDLMAYNYKDIVATYNLFKWLVDMLKKHQPSKNT